MFEKEAEESFMCKKVLYKWETDKRSYIDGFKDCYNKAFVEADKNLKAVVADFNKANEWHNFKTEKPPLRKEVLWCIDNQLWLGQLLESRIDFGEWELDSVLFNDYEIAWKEIVLPKEIKENE